MKFVQLLNAYQFFINKYINQSTNRWSFWHRHGETGKRAARNFLRQWQETHDRLMRTTFKSEEQAIDQLKYWVKNSMGSHHLRGNFNPHSLKNYILAFYDAIIQTGVDDKKTNEELFREFFTNKWEGAEPYRIESNYNTISGNGHNKSSPGCWL